MKYRFIVDPSLCTGCRTCELACAFRHAKNLKQGRSRIYPLAHAKDKYVPVTCLQCDDAACVKSCIFNALRIGTLRFKPYIISGAIKWITFKPAKRLPIPHITIQNGLLNGLKQSL